MFNFKIATKAFDAAGIDFLINVPATGMSPIYQFYSDRSACLYSSREEEAIAIASGISIGGKLPLVLVQQSGVGNMLNAYIGIADGYGIYFPILVLDRGKDDENPIQAHSSFRTIPIIKTFGAPCYLDFKGEESISRFSSEIAKETRWFLSKY
ncbi:hypothetical protein [Puia dinghuensis]|uniref:Thiamine pyrophosphate enzyme N-terminal TPP-binding domain-containing protein n=1 Tax=Puia dinghuensis TaxID=1792502 RepID=A0A8J2UB95_9BACT|nr:hypothetical protein [Puia dinghuensis]GGA93295.1 hypothetical protein GCM10011511_15880 [Puia dinghuensis]